MGAGRVQLDEKLVQTCIGTSLDGQLVRVFVHNWSPPFKGGNTWCQKWKAHVAQNPRKKQRLKVAASEPTQQKVHLSSTYSPVQSKFPTDAAIPMYTDFHLGLAGSASRTCILPAENLRKGTA